MKHFREKLTYANVMSTISVFLLLGGASAFAATQLAKNSVGSKQLKKNAVTAAKIKNDSVTGAKVKDGSLSGPDLAAGSITGTQLADGSVNSAKVLDKSLTGGDVGNDTLTGTNIKSPPWAKSPRRKNWMEKPAPSISRAPSTRTSWRSKRVSTKAKEPSRSARAAIPATRCSRAARPISFPPRPCWRASRLQATSTRGRSGCRRTDRPTTGALWFSASISRPRAASAGTATVLLCSGRDPRGARFF